MSKKIKQPAKHCGACGKTEQYLAEREDTYECSAVECPMRKHTMGLPDHAQVITAANKSGVYSSDHGYVTMPTTKD